MIGNIDRLSTSVSKVAEYYRLLTVYGMHRCIEV